MSPWVITTFEWTSLWLLVFVLASGFSALAYPALQKCVERCSPATRSLAGLALGLIPPLASLLVVVLVMHPTWANSLIPEHCHQGSCVAHAPMFQITSAGGMGLVASSVMILSVLSALFLRAIVSGQRRLSTIFQFTSKNDTPRYELLDSPGLVAWCCGLFRPRVVVSRGLLDRLSPDQLEFVLVHEEAHARRKDNLRHTLLHWATVFWPRSVKERIRADVSADAEESCDRAAQMSANGSSLPGSVIKLTDHKDNPPPVHAQTSFFHPRHRLTRAKTGTIGHSGPWQAWLAIWLSWVLHMVLLTGLAHFLLEWFSGFSG